MVVCLVDSQRAYQLVKRDADGEDLIVLDILGEDKGRQGITLGENLAGLYHLPSESEIDSGAYQEGARVSLFPRVNPRKGKLWFITHGNTVAEWEAIETLLWQVLKLKEPCVLRIPNSAGEWRELTLQLIEEPNDQSKQDLGNRRHAEHNISYVAGDPYWYGDTIELSIKRSQMTHEADGSWTGQIMVPGNPTDVDIWPIWASGQIDEPEQWFIPEMPNDDGTPGIQIPITPYGPIGAGKEFLVQTYPSQPTLLVMDDSQEWANLAAREFENRIKPGTPPFPVDIKLVGGTADSELQLTLVHRWERYLGGETL